MSKPRREKRLDGLLEWNASYAASHPECIFEQLDPEYQPLLKQARDLEELIDDAIDEESAGDPAKRQRYEHAFEYLTDRSMLVKQVGPIGTKELALTFAEEPADFPQLCLSGASCYVEMALFGFNLEDYHGMEISPVAAASAMVNGARLFGVFSGIRYGSHRSARASGVKRHRRSNEAKVRLLQAYLSNRDQFGSTKNEQAEKLDHAQLEILDSKKYLFVYETIREWLKHPEAALETALKNI